MAITATGVFFCDGFLTPSLTLSYQDLPQYGIGAMGSGEKPIVLFAVPCVHIELLAITSETEIKPDTALQVLSDTIIPNGKRGFVMKYEWKKQERELYGVKGDPQIVVVPPQNFIAINGQGNPNNEDFSERVGVLYSLAYPLKMRFKSSCKNNKELCSAYGYSDFAVFPLEGLWSSSNASDPLDKDSFRYTIMIRQPDCITKEWFDSAVEAVTKKKPHPLLKDVQFDCMEEGQSVQMLHKGSFDDEPASFDRMDAFVKEKGFVRLHHVHREIYLNNARRTAPEKRMTILRYQIGQSK